MRGKRLLLFFTVFLLLPPLFSFGASSLDLPDTPGVESVCLYNVENDAILYRKYSENGDKLDSGEGVRPIYPASTVKIMTALIALEYMDDPGRQITVTSEMIRDVSGNNIALKKGEVLSFGDLLSAVIVGGANDAANVLAFDIAGNQADFVRMMNRRAEEYGMTGTFYTNPYGIHNAGMVTTLDDTLTLARIACSNADFLEISSLPKITIPSTNLSVARTVYSRNPLVSRYRETRYYMEGASGLNAGSTAEGGYCLVTSYKDRGLTYICVVMGAGQDDEKRIPGYGYVPSLIEWAQKSYGYLTIRDAASPVCEIPVTLSATADRVMLRPSRKVEKYLPLDTDIGSEITVSLSLVSDSLAAPVSEGQTAGTMTLFYRGEEIGKVDLVTSNAVERSDFLYALSEIENVVSSPFFYVPAGLILLAVLVILLLVSRNRALRKRKRAAPPFRGGGKK